MQHSFYNRRFWKNVLSGIFLLLLLFNEFILVHHHAYAATSPQAVTVYGQGGNFTTATTGTTTTTLNHPRDTVEDSSGNLYISDFSNNRVLYYPSGSTTATRVYGQGGSFTTNTSSVSTTGLNGPHGLALDSSGNLYVADNANNRVLYYPSGTTTATRVYGQGGSFTTNTTNKGGVSANSLDLPNNIALDSSGNLYVTDDSNNRVLYYPAGTTTATRVYGQAGSFTTNTSNNGGVSATSLSGPGGVVVDSGGNLYIADSFNSRVLYYPSGTTTATVVYGQGGSFTTATGTTTATGLNGPGGVSVDSNNNLYVTDGTNSRVLYFPSGSTTATRVYGQGGSFTTGTANNGGVSATSINGPYNARVDSSGNVYISDQSNNRVLKFQTALSVTTQPPASVPPSSAFGTAASLVDVGSGGVFTDFTGTVTVAIKSGSGTNGATLGGTTSVAAVSGVATFSTLTINLTGAGYILTMSSSGLGSVDTNSFTIRVSPLALTVYGQAGSFTTRNSGTSSTTFNKVRGLALDSSGDLYAIDYNNSRVLYFPSGSTTATRVYGQGGSFTTGTANNGGISANSLNKPTGLALDSSGNLYVADTANSRILYYPSGTTTATVVYGQGGSFTTGTANTGLAAPTASTLSGPNGIDLDSGNNLYVADYGNNRVLKFPSGSTTASVVYGQAGSFITGTANNGGISSTSLYQPVGLGLDNSNNLYVADTSNHRVLYYPSGSTTATVVYGQAGSFATGTANTGLAAPTASTFNTPTSVVLDNGGNLYVTDENNNRVLYFPSGSTTATRVYGQGDIFTTSASNYGSNTTPSAGSFNQPFSLTIDGSGNLYVADYSNYRVLRFQTALSVTTQPPASTATNTAFTIASQLTDVGSGLVFSDSTAPVTATIKAGTGGTGATLGGTTTVTAVSGVSTFSNLTIDTGGTGYILTMSSLGVGSANTNTFTIVGALLFTHLTSPTFSFTLTGATTNITSQHVFKVNDTTGSGVGWHLTITSTQFTTGSKTLPTTATTITSVSTACTAGQTCVVPVNGVSSYPITVPAASVAPAAVTYFSANAGTGTGDVTLTVTFSISIPQGTTSGTYNSTVTETLVKGQ